MLQLRSDRTEDSVHRVKKKMPENNKTKEKVENWFIFCIEQDKSINLSDKIVDIKMIYKE